jgi:DNA-binding transcriptional regulator YiaG
VGLTENRRDIPDTHNSNIHLTYNIEVCLNLKDFDPDYPKEPKTLGERIRKARMDNGLMIKELAEQIGVAEDTVINWEIRDIKPVGMNFNRVQEFLKKSC